MFPWIFGGAVSSWDVAHGFARFCEKVVIFGSAFFGAGFGSLWAFGDGIRGDELEHFQEEEVLFVGRFAGGVEDVRPVAEGVDNPRQLGAGREKFQEKRSVVV